MIYLCVIVFAMFVGVYLIDDSLVTEQDKWRQLPTTYRGGGLQKP